MLREARLRYRQVVGICGKTDMFHVFQHIQETCAPHLQSLPHLQDLLIDNKNEEYSRFQTRRFLKMIRINLPGQESLKECIGIKPSES